MHKRLVNDPENNQSDKMNTNKADQVLMNFLHIGRKTNPRREAVRMAGLYIFMGIVWIIISDKLIEELVIDRKMFVLIGMIKGWMNVLLSGAVIYGIVLVTHRKMKQDAIKLSQSYQELRNTYDELEASHEELMASEEELRQQFDELTENQKRLSESEERYRLVSEATNDGIWDEQKDIRYFSERWYEITGFTKEEIAGLKDWKELIHPEDYKQAIGAMEEHLHTRTPFYRCEYRLKTKTGRYIWIQARGKALFDEKNNPYRLAGSHTDITELKEYQNRLQHMAYHNYLTALPNRQALFDQNKEPAISKRNSHFALYYIDTDNFKFINDTMGHNFGDQLIKALGKKILSLTGEKDNLYHLGSDEFVILADEISTYDEAGQYAAKILKSFSSPLKIAGSMIYAKISIGTALYPEHGHEIGKLLQFADTALHKAKEGFGSTYQLYDSSMNKFLKERMQMEKQLRTALKKDEFQLYYQPQFDLINKKITGFEALLRWNSPELGWISPLDFIPVAEETHFIIPLGAWILEEACAFIQRLYAQGIRELTIAVNLSLLQILQDDFLDMVLHMLETYQLEPQNLELEITETILMESYDEIVGKLNQLNNKGISIALDDFGKGYSSLSYLKQMPISTLKIDKSFIECIATEDRSEALMGHIISIGKSMGMSVVAEGVETKDQFDYLEAHQCQKMQGFLFCKPLPENEVMKLIKQY
jgi:PAS domain S-box/diguanylate cyclase (GGDEF) domain